jgi:G3E family GTPase
METRTQTPLTLLTGFLGAGKTTLLNRILAQSDGRLGVLVNDFGAIDIDGQLAESLDEDTVRFSGGCMCCEVRDEVEEGITRLLSRPDAPSHVLLEASGIADPFSLTRQLHGLFPLVAVDAVVTVVDADGLLKTRLPDADVDWTDLVLDQIVTADIVVLNKVDLVDDAQRAEAEAIVRHAVRRARVLPAVNADVPVELLLDIGGAANLADLPAVDGHRHLPFAAWSWTSDAPLSGEGLRRAVADLPTTVIRGKGIVALEDAPSERMVLQLVGRSATLNPGAPWDGPLRSELVLIGVKDALDEDALQETFDACRVPVRA